MNNLTQRVLTAVVLIAALLLLLFKTGTLAFAAAVFIFGALAVWELWRLVLTQKTGLLWLMLLTYAGFACGLWWVQSIAILWLVGAAHFVVSVWLLWKKPALAGLLSGLYGAVLLACVVYAMTVLQAFGAWVLITAMLVVWAADVGGYFFGKALGGRIITQGLAPTISPKKSWEGAAGGVMLALVVMAVCVLNSSAASAMQTWVIRGVVVGDYLMNHAATSLFIAHGSVLAITAMIAAYSVTGDLVESLLKRQAGVKDSSQLLPGHGGILDRIDALIPVLPLCAAWASFVGYR